MVTVRLRTKASVKGLAKRKSNLKKATKKSTRDAALFCQEQALSGAPYDTGRLFDSIDVRKVKKGYRCSVDAVAPNGFPYPKWVNQSAGFMKLKYPNGANFTTLSGHNILVFPGEVLVYGQSPNTWRFTGKARFFRTAIQRTRKRFTKLVVQNVNRAMKVDVS